MRSLIGKWAKAINVSILFCLFCSFAGWGDRAGKAFGIHDQLISVEAAKPAELPYRISVATVEPACKTAKPAKPVGEGHEMRRRAASMLSTQRNKRIIPKKETMI